MIPRMATTNKSVTVRLPEDLIRQMKAITRQASTSVQEETENPDAQVHLRATYQLACTMFLGTYDKFPEQTLRHLRHVEEQQ